MSSGWSDVSNSRSASAFVALGSNLGDSIRILRSAADLLQKRSVLPLRRSSLWRSAPVDCPPGSPDFLNAVVEIFPSESDTPETLLTALQQLEKDFGRRPKLVPNEPRPLDLDLLLFGAEVRDTPFLRLPHPRAHLRRFVLEPLAELAPDLVLAGQKKSVRELLATLRTDEVLERLSSVF